MLNHILVPLDGSPLAEKALDYAVQIVASKRQITLLYIVESIDSNSSVYGFTIDHPSVDEMVKNAYEYVNQIASELKRQHELTVTSEIKLGRPADVITQFAESEHVDAIVMSTHGRTGIERFIFGSVTQKVLNVMPCPVFVVPGKEIVKDTEQPAISLVQVPSSS